MSVPLGVVEMDETYDEYDEYDEFAEYDEYDEAARRRGRGARRPPVRTAGRQSAYRPQPNTSPVTQAQLQAALARVNSQITTNSNAIKAVDGRVRTASAEQARTAAMLRKEIADRKTAETATRREIQSTREMAVLLPLIAKDNPLIGLLLIGGGGSLFGGSADSTGAGGSSMNNTLVMALVLSEALKK
jgi:hypothetical protein